MRKLTLLIDDDVYEGLHRVAGRGRIGHFVSEKVRPFLVDKKQGDPAQAFGMLRHRARAVTPEDEAAAVRRYFARRHGPAEAAKSARAAKGGRR